MSLEAFWSNVRLAAVGVFPANVPSADEPQPTAEEVAARLRANTGWYRANSVVGFRQCEGELGAILSPGELAALKEAVPAFEHALVTKDREAAAAEFSRILGVMNFYRYIDTVGFRYGKLIEERLRKQGWPDYLRELRFWQTPQHDDFLVLSIYAHIKEAVVKTIARYLEVCWELRPVLNEIADETAPDWFSHVTFRTDDTLAEYAEQPDEDEDPVPARNTTPAVGGV
jgi:hypothetical protein